MSMKFRLFASVAAPVLSLPLMLQPASAFTPGMAGDVAKPVSGVVQVQQLLIPEGEQRERPRRERQEEQGGGERQQRREQRSQEDGGGERPQRRQAQEREQQQERPQRRQQAEEQQQERPQRRQQAEEQQQERPQRRQQAEERQQERQERRQQAEERQQDRQERRQQADERQNDRQERRQQADERQNDRQERRQQADERQNDRQERRQQAEERQQNRQERRQQAEERQQDRQERRQQAEGQQELDRQQRRQVQDAEQNRERDPRRDPQQAEQPRDRRDRDQADTRPRREPPRTPEQVERAREVARDPSRARDGEQVVLPVENGAAVLDSAKERRPDRDRRAAERPRRDNDRQAEQRRERPRSDRDAQANDRVTQEERERWRERRREIAEQRGERLDRRPDFERPRGWDFRDGPRGGDRDRDDGRSFFSIDNQTFVRNNDSRRFYRDGRRPEYERLDGGRYREIVERSDGTRIVTVRNRYGEVVQRSRIVRGGDEYVLYYAPTLLEDRQPDYVWRDPGDDLPPMRLTVPVEEYIIDTSSEPDRDYYEFLEQPPVEHVERAYSLDEVRYSSRIRDKVPRIDLDTITFATGSAEIPMNQAASLRKVADAINKVLDKDPSETFLIEGHTDAVGSDDSNLVLSDERAESVANVLTDAFGIPPENLTTQGYGESYLKVQTEAANQENRRVTIRRITPLVKPVAQNQ